MSGDYVSAGKGYRRRSVAEEDEPGEQRPEQQPFAPTPRVLAAPRLHTQPAELLRRPPPLQQLQAIILVIL